MTPRFRHAAFFRASDPLGSLVNATDDEMVALALTGQSAAFAHLVRRHSRTVYRVALRLTGNATDAEDVLQVDLPSGSPQARYLPARGGSPTWLYGIATNAALMQLRALKPPRRAPACGLFAPILDETGTYVVLDVDYSCAARADVVVEHRELARAAL